MAVAVSYTQITHKEALFMADTCRRSVWEALPAELPVMT